MVLTDKRRGIGLKVWDFFCSLRLTIFVLITLAATSIIGTVIQQNRPKQEYLKVYSEQTYELFKSLQFLDMYHSWWFLALLALFSVNLICCSIKRFPRLWRIVRHPVTQPSDSFFQGLTQVQEVKTSQDPEAAAETVAQRLRRPFGKVHVERSGETIYLFSQRGAWTRFGVYITHASILVILIGAIMGAIWGYKAFVNIPEGESVSRVWLRESQTPIELGFAVGCQDFEVHFYGQSQRPKEYMSVLDVYEGDKTVIDGQRVEVNSPLKYKGITFYQSNYGPLGSPQLQLQINQEQSDNSMKIWAHSGQTHRLPNGAQLRVLGFSEQHQGFGPAAQIEVTAADGGQRRFVVLQNFPDFNRGQGGSLDVDLLDYRQRYYTGLQVTKDPGVPVVWAGCALLVLGTLTAFFLSHRRAWAVIKPLKGGSTGVKVGASTNRNQPAFETVMETLHQELQQDLQG